MSNIRIRYLHQEPISDFEILGDNKSFEKSKENGQEERKNTATSGLDAAMEALSRRFVSASESHLFIVPFVVSGLLGLVAKLINVDMKNLLENDCIRSSETEQGLVYSVPDNCTCELSLILDRLSSTYYTLGSYERSLVIQLSTLFDILVAGLVKQIISFKPSVMDASDRKVDFADLSKFENIEDLRMFFFDKTIDSVVRKSRSDQFSWIESKLGIPLTKGLDGWADFIEINERRNLFTHTEGHVTKEYIENCTGAGIAADRLGKVGDKLSSNPQYVKRASELFFVIGIKLLQVVWRKLSEDFCDGNLLSADCEMIGYTYELNRNGKYRLSSQLGSFACGGVLKRHASETNKRMLLVNYAAALMLQRKIKDARKILSRLEWDVVNHEFAISVSAIRGDVEEVCRLMPLAVKSGAIEKSNLQEWPVFFEVRKDERFLTQFEKVFSEAFIAKRAPKQIDIAQRREISSQIRRIVSDMNEPKSDSIKQVH